jgi:hypothetical protein
VLLSVMGVSFDRTDAAGPAAAAAVLIAWLEAGRPVHTTPVRGPTRGGARMHIAG